MDDCGPFITKEVRRPFAPWMNDCIQEAMNIRNDTQKKLKADRHNIALQEQHKNEKKRVKTLIADTKAGHYHNKLDENKGKDMEDH